jgi:hypothetical protein
MKTLTLVSVADDEIGEVEGVFDAERKLITAWHCNDAQWRSEYFDELLAYLGAKLTRLRGEPTATHVQQLRNAFGFDD